jgi:hypothetical protein
MASGKRASMREGPLAALFRKTEIEGLEGSAEAPAPPAADPTADAAPTAAALPSQLLLDAARDTLVKSLTQLVAKQGENLVSRSALKNMMKRLMPDFDERALGCKSFTTFLSKFPDIVVVVDEEGGGHVTMVDLTAPAEPA